MSKNKIQSFQTDESSPNKWVFYQSPFKLGLWSFICISFGISLVLFKELRFKAVSIYLYVIPIGLLLMTGIFLFIELINSHKPILIFDDQGIHGRNQSILWTDFRDIKAKIDHFIPLNNEVIFYSLSSRNIYVYISFLKGNKKTILLKIFDILQEKTGQNYR